MLFSELLEAVKGLPRADKIQLINELQSDVGELSPEEAVIAQYLRPDAAAHMGWQVTDDQPDTVEVWFPEANPNAVAAALRALDEEKKRQ